MSSVAPVDTPAGDEPRDEAEEQGSSVERIREAGGHRVTGPGAMTGGLRRTVRLTWTLAYLDFRLKFFGSALGYFWQFARPAMYFGVYYLIFTQFIPLSRGVPYFAPTLLTGIMLYLFFAEVTGASVQSVLTREGLVRKIHFPRVVIPAAVVVTALLNLVANLTALGVFLALSRVPLRWTWLEFFPVFLLLIVFVSGIAMLLSALFVRYRDVAPIWEVASLAIFYGTPILYPLETVQFEWAKQLIMCNPLAVVAQQTRHALFDPSAPSAAEAIGGWTMMLIPFGIVVVTFIAGAWVFVRSAPRVAEQL